MSAERNRPGGDGRIFNRLTPLFLPVLVTISRRDRRGMIGSSHRLARLSTVKLTRGNL